MILISIDILLLQLFIGLSLGSIYAMMASGLSLIFGLMRVVNFAHGSFYMLGAFTIVYLISLIGNFWLSLIIAPLFIGGIGVLIEIFGIRRLYGTEEFNPLLLTLGLNYVFVDIIRILFGLGGVGSSIPKGLTGAVNLGFMYFPKYRFFMIVMGAVVLFLIWLFINKTNIGMVVRASIKDNDMVEMLGINIRMVWTMVFGIGIALAALSGALIAPITGCYPEMGHFMVIEAFVVVVIGGMGSFAGSVVAGILVGEVIAFTSLFYSQAGTVVMFVLMVVILLTTKAGLFGEEV
ncbi:MAG: branched-chain amino acid ABC transporter permease [Deltaproteobacteria bacterium]|nr:branched-chain amino acid ABC transporter permease [Deltaproteobacteria bacterium]